MPQDFQLVTVSPEETQEVSRVLGEQCMGGELFLLVGSLGSGKTCFTQGLAWGLGVKGYIHSPSFVMVTQYPGRRTLYHIDLYRVESVEEAVHLGLDEYLDSPGVCAIEWADKALAALDRQGLLIQLEDLGGERRRLTFQPSDRRHQTLLEGLEALLIQRR